MGLTSEQQKAVEMVKKHPVSILTGAPGVGKTFALKYILDWAKSENLNIVQASPTGKAAKQMQKSTDFPASTIHKMLEPRFENDKFVFTRNEKNQLRQNFIVLDETSMITNSLMANVVKAIPNNAKLLMVGDFHQLESIGAGMVLRDLIQSGIVPFTELTEIQRNSGDIVIACHRIKDGKSYIPSKTLDPENGLNLRHIEVNSLEGIQQVIKKIVCERMPERGYDPIKDVQVLSPVNKRTIVSCDGLNKILQNELNSNPAIENVKYRVKDKVIQTKNMKIQSTIGQEEIIVNGDMGTVLDIDTKTKKMVVRFENPTRDVYIPTSREKNHLLLAYAITVHRFQGSESPVVVIPIHSSFNFFIDRCWLYTAISRAQEICITVGSFESINRAIGREMVLNRKTMLREKLQK